MRILMNKIFVYICACVGFLSYVTQVQAIDPGKIRINSIEINDVIPVESESLNYVPIIDGDNYIFEYVQSQNAFYVRVASKPFKSTLMSAQRDILTKLDVSKNEACYLGIYATGPSYLLPDNRDTVPLPFCEGPAQVDFNEDTFVNGVDYSVCLDEAVQSGLVFDHEADYQCDLNVNRRVDALDLSKGIQYFGMMVTEGESEKSLSE